MMVPGLVPRRTLGRRKHHVLTLAVTSSIFKQIVYLTLPFSASASEHKAGCAHPNRLAQQARDNRSWYDMFNRCLIAPYNHSEASFRLPCC
jgi:hypothetical protein